MNVCHWAVAAAVGLSVACGGPSESFEPLPEPDFSLFVSEISPILEARCADGGCHGSPLRPFALYAVGRHRLAPQPTFSRVPLEMEELSANYHTARGFIDAPSPLETTLLHKALSRGGEEAHGGGAVFQDASDPECEVIARWLQGDHEP